MGKNIKIKKENTYSGLKNIRIKKEKIKLDKSDLEWQEDEQYNLEERIINLKKDQIAALLGGLVVLKFLNKDIKKIVEEIKHEKHESINLSTLLTEADSKENLIWWVNYFENYNK